MDRSEFSARLEDDNGLPEMTAVFHQGACAVTTETDGRYMLETNFTFSKRLFHACVDRRVPFLYASSAAVYGTGTDFAVDPANERPLNVYAYSKLLFDQYVRRYLEKAPYALVTGLRYFNVYGPGEAHKGAMASMVTQLHRQLRETGVARLFGEGAGYGPGEHRRDFVHVDDVVAVNLSFLEREETGGIVNVGTGQSRSFQEVARLLIDRLGKGKIKYVPFPHELKAKYQAFTEADLSGLRAAGYEAPFTPLEEGLDRCLAAWREETP
jgi:ADP-L-glycero-D-manno-heptose 6-epimerase